MITRRHITALGGTLAAATFLGACGEPFTDPSADESPQTSSDQMLTSVVTTGLQAPWSIAFSGETALVSERDSARILEIAADGATREVGVIDGVEPGGEGGLLGLAVHGGQLFTYLTAADGNRIERRELTGSPGRLGLGDARTVLEGIPSARIHNGGRLAIGPDDMLYATTGDAGDRSSAQDIESLGGKILRMAPDGTAPADNPFPDSLVYSYGHRNCQGIAWAEDGTMYASECGQDTWDELNLIEAGGNYGWPDVEGIAEQEGYRDPLQQWEPAEASPSGIAITGGSLYLANLRGRRLRVVPLTDPSTATELLVGEYRRLRDVVLAPDGALWVLTNTTDGRGDPAEEGDRIVRVEIG
ncbi:MAG: PQQ-dependent sugar dehydrogenase [Brachybacterium sp.]|uniref:PQQ-dependent sugar dehydrogenase n=1 Tax=Brachybacterium sp. TaxID=1891286 RepID=UPI002647D226|nr:PQQ-dependent sugar dehydrogenase [Brachybacterium sp.]MDN5685588.1 PQQ-dependent sugar dehydrogenase [Brachybacterium sp.]